MAIDKHHAGECVFIPSDLCLDVKPSFFNHWEMIAQMTLFNPNHLLKKIKNTAEQISTFLVPHVGIKF